MTKIKASITAGIRPCSMIFHEQPTDEWTRFDFLLLEAYQILQDETCPSCGQPVWLCRSGDPNINIKILKTICHVSAAIERKQASDEKNKRKMRPGESYYPVVEAIPLPGARLPTRREFYESQERSG